MIDTEMQIIQVFITNKVKLSHVRKGKNKVTFVIKGTTKKLDETISLSGPTEEFIYELRKLVVE